jgi:hypothetical protein
MPLTVRFYKSVQRKLRCVEGLNDIVRTFSPVRITFGKRCKKESGQ